MRSSLETTDNGEGLRLRGVLARGTRAAFVLQVAGAGLGYGAQILLARWMGAAEYGLYTYALSWAGLLAVLAGLGLRPALLRFIPEYTARETWGRLRGVLRRSSRLTLIAGLAVALLGTLWLEAFDDQIRSMYRAPLVAGLWLVPLLALANLQAQMARAARRMTLAFAPTLLARPLLLAGGALALFLTSGHISGLEMLGVAGGALALVVVLQHGLLRHVWPAVLRRTRPVYETRAWLRVALPLLFVDSFLILLSQTDRLMIGALLGPEEVARYHVAARTAGLILFPFAAVNAMAAPLFASLYAQGKSQTLHSLAHTVARWSFWPALLLAGVVVGFSEPILGLFGDAYREARPELVLLVATGLANVGTGSVGYLMNLTGHQDRSAAVYGWSAALNIGLNAVAIPHLGTLGAALATACTTVLWNLWLYRLVVRFLSLRPDVVSALTTRNA